MSKNHLKYSDMTKRLACIQSNYIPWKGYFDIINYVDEFILYDDVQYTKDDWRNRNKIKTENGTKWLTIPISVSNKFGQLIKDAKTVENKWAKSHWSSIEHNYRTTAHFKKYRQTIKSLYNQCAEESYLSKINYIFIKQICSIFEISTKLTWSMDYHLGEKNPNKRLIEICKKANVDIYVSGPSAINYLDPELWESENIKIEFFSYEGYQEYPQLFPPFTHNVSALDLIFNVGDEAKNYLLSNIDQKNANE